MIPSRNTRKVKLLLCPDGVKNVFFLTEHYAMKAYWGMEI
jgi:hypothetical protein